MDIFELDIFILMRIDEKLKNHYFQITISDEGDKKGIITLFVSLGKKQCPINIEDFWGES